MNEIIADQCAFHHDWSISDQIFCSHQILEKSRNKVNQLFIYFKKTYDSVRREVLCNN